MRVCILSRVVTVNELLTSVVEGHLLAGVVAVYRTPEDRAAPPGRAEVRGVRVRRADDQPGSGGLISS